MPLQRLPLWIQISAFILALNAGMMNSISLLTIAHQSISHMTGNMSMLAMDGLKYDWPQVLFLIGVVTCYVLGSFYSGFIIRDAKLQLGRRYGSVLSLEAVFLLITWVFIQSHPHYALLWATAALGMQNAMASNYNGTIIRTTHLSGVLTDIGLALGYRARGLYVDPRRITLHVLIVTGFLLGGIIGVLVHSFLGRRAFLAPATLTLLLMLTYWIYYWRVSRHLSKDE